MRDIEVSGWMMRSSRAPARLLFLTAIALGIGLVMTSSGARAEDDDDDDKTFEEKLIGGIIAGVGGTNMENRGIEYRSGRRWWCLPSSTCHPRPPRPR